MNAKFHLCLLLIFLGTITVQGAVTKKNFFAKRAFGGGFGGGFGGECSWKWWILFLKKLTTNIKI